MKTVKNIFIFYTVMMIAALAGMLYFVRHLEISAGSIGSYDSEQLEIYRDIWNDMNSFYDEGVGRVTMVVVVFWAVNLMLGYAVLLLIYVHQIKPVLELEKYASEIAKGNLDVPLSIRKDSVSESFTESFDLMREELKTSKARELEAEKAKQ